MGHGGRGPSGFAGGQPLGPRQSFFLSNVLTQKSFFINSLCRGPQARPSAKIFFISFVEGWPKAKVFKKNSLPRVVDETLGKSYLKNQFF